MLTHFAKWSVFAAFGTLMLGLGVVLASTTEVTHPVQSHVNITVLRLQWSADVDFSGRVDFDDLAAVTARLCSPAYSGDRVGINQDGVVDVLDLAIVARYLGQDVQL